uniref:Uncharacterized protein n=1 Tax=Bracon brevicornis TaxID=1563983 RepID=A0A6V7MD70_9HYME
MRAWPECYRINILKPTGSLGSPRCPRCRTISALDSRIVLRGL